MLAGRRYFYSIFGLLLVFSAANVTLWILRERRSGGPSFGLYDLRSEMYLPPYEPVDGDSPAKVTVFGSALTYSYELERELGRLVPEENPPPIATFDVPAAEEVVLPDGHRIRLRAIAVYPQNRGPGAPPLSVEEVFLHPSGRWMTREEGEQLYKEIEPDGDPDRVTTPYRDHYLAYYLGLVLETDLEPSDLDVLGLYDTKTGGCDLAFRSGVWWLKAQADKRGTRSLMLGPFHYAGVRPTPLALHLRVLQGEKTVLTLFPNEPRDFEWQGKTYAFRGLDSGFAVRCRSPIMMDMYGSNYEPEFRRGYDPLDGMWAGGFRLMLDSLPPGITSVETLSRNGSPTGLMAMKELGDTDQGQLEPTERVELHLKPENAYVVLRLPEIPVVPEQNRRTEDLMKLVLPPMVIDSDWRWQKLLSALLQAEYRVFGIKPKYQLSFPIDVGGKTVGEILKMEHDIYGEYEFVTARLGQDVVMRRHPLGADLARNSSHTGLILTAFQNLTPWFLGLFGIVTMMNVISLARAATLRRALRLRGYEELTIWDVEFLHAQLGAKAWKLPHREELATIPGIDANNPESLAKLMRRAREEVVTLPK